MRSSRDSRRAGNASQTKNWHAANATRQPNAIHQQRVDRRTRNARHRNEKQRSELTCVDAGVMQSPAERLLTQFLRDFNPDVVSLSPRFDVVVFLRRQGKITALHGHVAMEARQHIRILEAVAPVFLQLFEEELLRIVILRKGAGCAGNFHSAVSHFRPASAPRLPKSRLGELDDRTLIAVVLTAFQPIVQATELRFVMPMLNKIIKQNRRTKTTRTIAA